MKKKFIKKWTACLLAFCTIFATVGPELALVVKASSDSKQDAAIKTAMENLEKDWAGYLYDYEGDKIGTGSVLLGDDDTSSLVHKDDYTSGGYTSMADYMYSFNSAGELVRDVDYSFTQDRKTGFLYYKTALTNFELNFEYKHSSSSSGVGWNGIYIGMGASAEGTIWTNEANNLAMFIQPKVHYVRCGSTANINSLVYNSGLKNVDYSAMETKWNTNKDAWYTYRLVMENKVATWYIDGNQIATYTIDGYTGGHIYFGTMAKDTSFRNIQVTNKDNPYLTMAGIEADFKAAFQDQAGSNFSASSPIITDENISDMENYAKYTTDGYTSLADYLFSVDSTGAIVRDIDYGIGGNRKNGFLYYDTEMTNFTLEMEYRHVVPKVGWTTMYVGMGAQTIGGNHFTDNKVSSLRIQPEELYLEQNGSVVADYSTDSKYSAAKTKWQEGNTAGTPNWFSFKLTVADGVATWWIDNQEFSKSLTNYEGGYIFFGGMAQNTAFRNIKITNNDSVQTTPDYSMYDVYYATESDKNVNKLTSITKTDFTNCWSLEEGTFTRTGTGAYAGTTSASKGASMLYFNTKQYDAFEMTFDYSFGTAKGGWKWAAVGFGADAPGKSYIDGDGYMAFIENEGQIAYLYPASQEALGYKSDRLTGKNDTYNAKVNNVVDATWHSAKIKVAGGKLTMSYDGGPEASVNLTDYNGYVYLCAFTQGMQYKNVSITETSDADTSYGDQFAAYYLPNGKDLHTNYVPLTSGKISDLWTVNGETLTRSGSGTYAAGPNKVQGASMLYFGDQYTNFELSYDFSFNGTTATWKWVGAGFGASEKGKYYGDGDGFMARVEQEGTRFLMQGTSQVYENKTQIPAYRDVVKANTGDTSWHTYKLVVKGKNVEIHIDNHEVAKTTISGYTGGYVYLFSATPGMTIKNVNLKEVPYEIPELQKKFTAYYLPNGTEANANFVPLKSAEVDSLWVVTEDTVTRSGTGQYAAGPDRAKGASMLYFKTPYTNFSLSYDFTFDGTTATWKWVGAGFGASAAGKYYGDGDGYMAFIEQEGYRSMFTGQTSGRIASEKLEDYHALLTAGDSTWHSFNLVVKGDVVEIYLDNYPVAKTTVAGYAGGYVYLFGATPGLKMKNIEIEEISYIKSVGSINNITVAQGTPVSKLNLPTSIGVTLNDDTTKQLPIVWDTSNYNGNAAGKYILSGNIDLTGTSIYKNDSARVVKVAVTVADFDTSKVKVYDFSTESQLNDTFISYYVGKDNALSATSELKKADPIRTWTPTESGGIKRAGTGDYAPSLSKALGGSLLYFKDKYTEFELDFDYTFNGTAKGWRWMTVGVGAEDYGKTGYHANGGTMAVVEQEGQIRTFANDKTVLLTDKQAFAGYQETVSTAVHHMKVAVKNSRLYVYVDNYPVADTALTNYNGGYIYLYGFTENLELFNIRMSSIATAELAQEAPYKSVQKGTKASAIGLPATLKVKLNGQTIDCPVEWTSPDYDSSKEGTYNFFATPTGKYSHLWLSNNTKRVQAGVTVGNTDEDVVQNFALTSTEELESYFESYFCKSEYQLFEKGQWNPIYAGNTWKVDSKGVLKRTGKTSEGTGGGAKGTFGVGALYYKEKLENFEIEFDYRHGDGGWKWVSVMFGQKAIGDTYYDNGYLAWVEQEGKVRIQGNTNGGDELNFKDTFAASRLIEGYKEKREAIKKGESDEWFHYRLVVTNGVARVYVNDTLWSCSLADNYKGGYIALSANSANTVIKNLSITNYDAKEIIVASVQSTKELGCDYIEIDKKKGDTLSMPEELIVTDTNGYQYNLPIDWVNNQYRSGKLGTFKFAGNPILPSKMFKNPNKVAAEITVKVTRVDFNPKTTVKYYFDNANDLLDFTDYYSENTAEKDLAVSDWTKHWSLQDGQLLRNNDDFKNPSGDKFGTYRKVSRLTYNKEMKGNYQLDVDYKQDTGTYMWAMICFGIKDKTQFVVEYNEREEKFYQNELGGTAVYLEKEGSVNYWGNMAGANLEGTRLRLLDTAEKFEGYDSKEMHHMTVTVINGVARVFIDGYDTNVAVRIPEEALGSYVSLMSNSNAVTFDNFAITTLGDDVEDKHMVKVGDYPSVTFNHKNAGTAENTFMENVKNVLGIVIPVGVFAVAITSLLVLCVVYRKKHK